MTRNSRKQRIFPPLQLEEEACYFIRGNLWSSEPYCTGAIIPYPPLLLLHAQARLGLFHLSASRRRRGAREATRAPARWENRPGSDRRDEILIINIKDESAKLYISGAR